MLMVSELRGTVGSLPWCGLIRACRRASSCSGFFCSQGREQTLQLGAALGQLMASHAMQGGVVHHQLLLLATACFEGGDREDAVEIEAELDLDCHITGRLLR